MKLYDYSSSNASVRVRIILYLKDIPFDQVEVDLLGRRQPNGRSFFELNSQGMVPTLVHGDFVLTQSIAIAEYLDEMKPLPRLLPSDAKSRAHVRSLALITACDGQPIVNLRVRRFLQKNLGFSRQRMVEWMQHWLSNSINEYEGALKLLRVSGLFSYGNEPTIADVFLVPHVLLSQRFGVDLSPYKLVGEIYERCMQLAAFQRASSEYAVQDAEYGI